MKGFIIMLATIVACENKSLREVICDVNPRRCNPPDKTRAGPFLTGKLLHMPHGNLAAPSAQEFSRWQNYENGEGAEYAPPAGPGWRKGLGDINIATGLAAYTPFSRLGIRRDFDIHFGGSGRSGGRSFGFGNGFQKLVGSVP
ncbi:hypothetical protein KIN20_004971 [Parelaphostrongylus tenuis]|uniref:Uncharacterized protein n=1 Tax=Parelaphostrongylus tenuis TaxID=148309 RepID=A0AAD5MS29_PARTN|nr:hypothetical protein KIN20_004971 [Parelaphostrongylus tenuis]